MANMFSSLTANTRSKKMMIVIAATAALLVIALLSLLIVSIATAGDTNPDEETTPVANNGIPSGFVTTTFAEGQLYRGNLIAVNDTYAYNSEANASVETVLIQNGRPLVDGTKLYSSNATMTAVQKEALDALNEMIVAFYDASDISTDNYDLWVNLGSLGSANGIYAAGNTFELRYTTGDETAPKPAISKSNTYDWIFKNAYKYGFVSMYAPVAETTTADGEPAPESQEHIFRYVGTVHAQIMTEKKIASFEDYLTYLRENTTPSKSVGTTLDKKNYKVYYLAQDAQQIIPEKYKDTCVVSGDNMSGYIVTYCTTTTKK